MCPQQEQPNRISPTALWDRDGCPHAADGKLGFPEVEVTGLRQTSGGAGLGRGLNLSPVPFLRSLCWVAHHPFRVSPHLLSHGVGTGLIEKARILSGVEEIWVTLPPLSQS